jgi:hypothetical protein
MINDRFIRLKDAGKYLGMDKNRFNAEVRPILIEIPIGKIGIAFDRLDLDDWADVYKQCNGRPSKRKGEPLWDEKAQLDSMSAKVSGILINKSKDTADFAKAVKLVNERTRNKS